MGKKPSHATVPLSPDRAAPASAAMLATDWISFFHLYIPCSNASILLSTSTGNLVTLSKVLSLL